MKNDPRQNLKFEYLYRDAGNYKQYGYVVIKNPSRLSPEQATKIVQKSLIDGEFFDSSMVDVPRLEIYDFDPELDHGWYEFDKVTLTGESPTLGISFENFLCQFK